MIPVELFVGALRDRLVARRNEEAIILASKLRSGETHEAIVKSGFIAGLEAAHDLINDIIKESNQ